MTGMPRISSIAEIWSAIGCPGQGSLSATSTDPMDGTILGARLNAHLAEDGSAGRLLIELWRQEGTDGNDRFFPLLLLEAKRENDGVTLPTLEIGGHAVAAAVWPTLAATVGQTVAAIREHRLDHLPLLSYASGIGRAWGYQGLRRHA